MRTPRTPSAAQLEQALREKVREVDVLHRITDSITNTLDLEAVLKHIVEVVVEAPRRMPAFSICFHNGGENSSFARRRSPSKN